MSPALIDSGAEFDDKRLNRYRLWRRWADGPLLMVVGLNPSTADETKNDPTVTRCIGYAQRWGFAGLEMCNLFPYRATDPGELIAHVKAAYQEGDRERMTYLRSRSLNHYTLKQLSQQIRGSEGAVLAAWGNHGGFDRESMAGRQSLGGPESDAGVACLGFTSFREPKHPLYLRADAKPIPFLGDGGCLCTQPFAEIEKLAVV